MRSGGSRPGATTGTNLNLTFPDSAGTPAGVVTDSSGDLLTGYQTYGTPASIQFFQAGSTSPYQQITAVNSPTQIAIGGSNLLYVSDQSNNGVEVFQLNGTPVTQITGLSGPQGVATSDGQFGQPWSATRHRVTIHPRHLR